MTEIINPECRITDLLVAMCEEASLPHGDECAVEAAPGGRRLRLTFGIADRAVSASWPHPAAHAACRSPSIGSRLRRRLAELRGLPIAVERRDTPEGVAETWDVVVGTEPTGAMVLGIHGTDAAPGDALVVSPSSPGFDARIARVRQDDPDVPIEGMTRRIVEMMRPMVLCTVVVADGTTEFSFRSPIIRNAFPSDPLEIMRAHSQMHDLLQTDNAPS